MGCHNSNDTDTRPGTKKNVGQWERALSDAAGVAMLVAAFAARKRSFVTRASSALAGAALLQRGVSGRCALYRGWGISTAKGPHSGINVMTTAVVEKGAQELYRFWRNLTHVPQFMEHIESVAILDGGRSRWKTKGPFGMTFSWEAETTADSEGEYIAWKSVEGSELENIGSVRFVSIGAERTNVILHIRYNPPGGRAGDLFARIFGPNPEMELKKDLRRFKQLMEAGEVATTDGQPSGNRKLVEVTQFIEARSAI